MHSIQHQAHCRANRRQRVFVFFAFLLMLSIKNMLISLLPMTQKTKNHRIGWHSFLFFGCALLGKTQKPPS
ncbi:MAG: hypothetical protein D8M56_07425 [Chloroflexi bacterium]|nr:hypothetical protein [Chloroflexota bacterium]